MIQKIAVCGAGTMGSGIAQVAAQAGFATILFDLNETVLEKAKTSIAKNLSFLADKGKISAAQKDIIYSNILFTNNISDCVADLIIEAIIEKVEAKVDLFNKLAEFNNNNTIFASNTSSLSVTDIAAKIKQPGRVIGLHFFNPAPLMKLVEIVNTAHTKKEITEEIYALTKQFGKTPVICKDAPGFIVNRVARHYYLEALKLVELGLADYETIDTILESTGFKMGPFHLMDLIGNDINFAVTTSLYEACGKPVRFKPSPIQEEKVRIGELGRKTGKGYYNY
jgi:3-hydroxybutyryl-CoA dehydrogenase